MYTHISPLQGKLHVWETMGATENSVGAKRAGAEAFSHTTWYEANRKVLVSKWFKTLECFPTPQVLRLI